MFGAKRIWCVDRWLGGRIVRCGICGLGACGLFFGRGRSNGGNGFGAGAGSARGCAAENGGGGAAATFVTRGGLAAILDDGCEGVDREATGGEVLRDVAEARGANGGTHVAAGGFGIDDFGDLVPRRFVFRGDVVEIHAGDEEVVEELMEVGVHGEIPKGQSFKGPTGQIGRARNSECGMEEGTGHWEMRNRAEWGNTLQRAKWQMGRGKCGADGARKNGAASTDGARSANGRK